MRSLLNAGFVGRKGQAADEGTGNMAFCGHHVQTQQEWNSALFGVHEVPRR